MNGLLSPDDMMMAGAQGVPSVDENALMQSLYGMGDYSEPHFLLPIANVGGEIVPSFPGFVQPIARTVARSQGELPLDIDPNTGLPTEDVLMDAFDLAGAVTGAGLLMERPAGSIGMGGRVKASPSSRLYDDLFENMGDEGAGLEFPDVGEAVNKYIYDMDFNALQSALKSDDYSGYSKNLRTNLDSLFPNDKISVSRVENYSDPYAGIEGRRSKSFFDVDKDDVLFVGSDAERELIVRGASGSPMSVRIEETPRSSGLLGMGGRKDIAALRRQANIDRFGYDPNEAPAGLLDEPDVSYRMDHQPRGPEDDLPVRLDDLTKSTTGEAAGFPDDFYTPEGRRIFAPGPRFADDEFGIAGQQSYRAILGAKGNPDAEVTIYRGVPNDPDINTINRGDFVTLSPKYAELHAASGYGRSGDEPGKVISQKVKVKDIYWDGNDVNEFGYFPPKKQGILY